MPAPSSYGSEVPWYKMETTTRIPTIPLCPDDSPSVPKSPLEKKNTIVNILKKSDEPVCKTGT